MINADGKLKFKGKNKQLVLMINALKIDNFRVFIRAPGEAPKAVTGSLVTMSSWNDFKLKKKVIERIQGEGRCIDAKDGPTTIFKNNSYTKESCHLSCNLESIFKVTYRVLNQIKMRISGFKLSKV